jgi:hypothetical protein
MTCYSVNLPCAKFMAALLVTFISLVFACVMIALEHGEGRLTPFYCSLITGAVSFWAQAPNYKDEDDRRYGPI